MGGIAFSPKAAIILPNIAVERQTKLDHQEQIVMQRMRIPVILNFPVAIAELPYLVVTHREWRPKGMPIETWRAISWPLAGLLFWWLAGRGIDALYASSRLILRPRISWIETVWAATLLIVGIVTLIGIATTTPDDQRDKNFMALLYGGVFWAVLSGPTLASCLRQRHLSRKTAPDTVN